MSPRPFESVPNEFEAALAEARRGRFTAALDLVAQALSVSRDRERGGNSGAQALSDAALLALVLGTGCGGANALDIARQLLQHFGRSLRRL